MLRKSRKKMFGMKRLKRYDVRDAVFNPDVKFIFNGDHGEVLYGNREYLGSRCEYFNILLNGRFIEGHQNEIAINDPLQPFKQLLEYCYFNKLDLNQFNETSLINLISLADKYQFDELLMYTVDHLKLVTTDETYAQIYNSALESNANVLIHFCRKHLSNRNAAIDYLESEYWLNLPLIVVVDMISSSTIPDFLPQTYLFRTVKKWCKVNKPGKTDSDMIMAELKFRNIDSEDILNIVYPSDLVKPSILMEALKWRTDHGCLHERNPSFNYRVTYKKNNKFTISQNSWKYYYHEMSRNESSTVILDQVYVINCIQFTLLDKNLCDYITKVI